MKTTTVRPFKYVSKQWRWIEFDKDRMRLSVTGLFTADDFRNLADWLENPQAIADAETKGIDVKLSQLE